MDVTRRGRFDYEGADPNEVAVAQMIEMFDEYAARVIGGDQSDDRGAALRAAGLPLTAKALGL